MYYTLKLHAVGKYEEVKEDSPSFQLGQFYTCNGPARNYIGLCVEAKNIVKARKKFMDSQIKEIDKEMKVLVKKKENLLKIFEISI